MSRQATIYDSLAEADVSFQLYSNSTIGFCPELALDGVSRHLLHCASHTRFYKAAKEGLLPKFSYLVRKTSRFKRRITICELNEQAIPTRSSFPEMRLT